MSKLSEAMKEIGVFQNMTKGKEGWTSQSYLAKGLLALHLSNSGRKKFKLFTEHLL